MKKKDAWRLFAIGIIMMACFVGLAVRLANLQVRGADEYGAAAESSMTKTIYESGTRGQILDVNGAVLAYDKKVYNLQFYRSPGSDQAQNGEYSKAIWEVIKLMRQEGKEISFDFWLARDEDGLWYFDTKTTDTGVAVARERMFRSNFYVSTLDVQDIFERLCSNYMIHDIDKEFPAAEKLTLEDKLVVLSVWQEMQMNAFNSIPITLAKDVRWATVMEVETRMLALPGISVSVDNQRVYPKGTLACHVLGYTGLMQSPEQIEEYVGKGYQRNDTIGLDGVERTMEQWLTANSSLRRGYSVVEVDRAGRKIRELSRTEAADGNSIKLTIDTSLQQVAERALAKTVGDIRVYEEGLLQDSDWLRTNQEELMDYEANGRAINLAQNGAVVVLDMNCRVLAMASYPSYDPNRFILGMTEEERLLLLRDDPRKPLFNNAIRAADTPGSVFKMCTALAGLATGKLTTSETISDGGYFTLYDPTNPPKCWIALGQRGRHANLNVVQALEHSCNFFFYTVASRLSNIRDGEGELLYQYAAKLGLTSRTNVDLPGERKSIVGSQVSLYDPTKPINGEDQDTWYPVQVRDKLKEHLRTIGEMYSITYGDERLDKCAKALMDMAVNNDQGAKQANWVRLIRQVLMEELGMTMEMVYRQVVVGDIVIWLNDIKWGGSYTIQTAIGQSITMTTPVAMARYIAAIANGGFVYDVQIIDSIIAPNGEVINSFDQPVLVNDLSRDIGPYLEDIKKGMARVVDQEGTAEQFFRGFAYLDQIGGKTGTAEKTKLDVENNAWFVAFAPYDNPEIAIAVYIPHGLSGGRSSPVAREIIEYYLDSKVEDAASVLPAPNGLAQ